MKVPVFTADSLSAGYGGHVVLDDISFMIRQGEIVSLIGQNGTGKSTLIKTLSGVISPIKGKALFHDRDIDRYSRRELASSMSVVSPITGNIPDYSVRTFLSFGLFSTGKLFSFNRGGDLLIERTAVLCGIDTLLDRPVRELSAGEFQLVQIGRALVQNRDVILLDEPVSNLDYRHMIQVMEIISTLNKNGATVMCALHDVNTAIEYSTRIIAIKEGGIIFDGEPERVINEKNLLELYDSNFYCGRNPVTGRLAVYPVPGLI